MRQTSPASAPDPERQADDVDQLMALFQGGDIAAFERLYAALAPALGGFLRRLAPPGAEVDDLVQTTFLQMHKARATYLPGLPVKPWAYAIARNVARMASRSRARSTAKETPLDERPEELAAPAARALAETDRLTLEAALTSLPDSGREALWLHHVAGLSFREVAQVQGVRETAAKVRAFRALAALRARFAPGAIP